MLIIITILWKVIVSHSWKVADKFRTHLPDTSPLFTLTITWYQERLSFLYTSFFSRKEGLSQFQCFAFYF